MSASLRNLKKRIRSVENTKKITRAMELVSAAKLQRYQNRMQHAQAFTNGLEKLMRQLHPAGVEATDDNAKDAKNPAPHPFLETRQEKRVTLVILSSDTGLCGSYNNDLTQTAQQFIQEHSDRFKIALIGIGKMGTALLEKRGFTMAHVFKDLRGPKADEAFAECKLILEKLYAEKETDGVYAVYGHVLSASNYVAAVSKLLPIKPPSEADPLLSSSDRDTIFEPDRRTVFEKLIPLFFEAKMKMIFLESQLAEQIARMRAMHQATENAQEMTDSLVLLRNKARQATITKELIEIVTGAKALRR